jgi:hypothetical protein
MIKNLVFFKNFSLPMSIVGKVQNEQFLLVLFLERAFLCEMSF